VESKNFPFQKKAMCFPKNHTAKDISEKVKEILVWVVVELLLLFMIKVATWKLLLTERRQTLGGRALIVQRTINMC